MTSPQCSLHRRGATHAVVRRAIGTIASAVLLVMCGCVYFAKRTPPGFCTQDLGAPIRNFCVVEPLVLWEGERPTTADARWLLEHGVASVVSLQLDDRATFRATALPSDLQRSVRYFRVRGFSALQLLSRARIDDRVALFIAIVRRAPKPIYVHCRAGVDRTVVLAAAYRVLVQGFDREEAVAEIARFHSPWFYVESRYLRSLTPARRSMILRAAGAWEQRIRASAEIHCSNGRCDFGPVSDAE